MNITAQFATTTFFLKITGNMFKQSLSWINGTAPLQSFHRCRAYLPGRSSGRDNAGAR
jgi:hypothetical protein